MKSFALVYMIGRLNGRYGLITVACHVTQHPALQCISLVILVSCFCHQTKSQQGQQTRSSLETICFLFPLASLSSMGSFPFFTIFAIIQKEMTRGDTPFFIFFLDKFITLFSFVIHHHHHFV